MTELVQRLAAAGLKSPNTVTLAITNRCNLNCRHCWPESLSDADAPSADADALKRLILGFRKLGAETLVLTGGEPLLHPHWHAILSDAAALGFDSIILQTNAMLIGENEIMLLSRLAPSRIFIQVSVEGAAGPTHDYVRGTLSFERTLEGIRRLKDAGLGDRIILAFTEMWHNFDDIPDALTMADHLGVAQFVTHTLVRDGRAGKTDQLAPPDPDQYRRLLARYARDAVFRKRYQRLGRIAALEWLKGRDTPADSCCTTMENPYVTVTGTLYPCIMLHADDYAARNLHERPFDEAILEMIPRWCELEEIRRRRADSLSNCGDCPGRRHCGAGCMGRAHARHGRLIAPEDRCALRRAVYEWREEGTSTGTPTPPGG